MSWKGIVGKSLRTPAAFGAYLDTVKMGLWRPRFVVVHNTSAPDLATYLGYSTRKNPISDEQWLRNLEGYYRDQQHWSAGPHLFVTPKSICVFTPLNTQGTHSPSWNGVSWGVETVGEFERDPFDGAIRDNLIAALGMLHAKAGLQVEPYERGVRGLHFHKEDPKTTHKSCPGRNLKKPPLVAAVKDYIAQMHAGEHHVVAA